MCGIKKIKHLPLISSSIYLYMYIYIYIIYHISKKNIFNHDVVVVVVVVFIKMDLNTTITKQIQTRFLSDIYVIPRRSFNPDKGARVDH